MTVWHGFIPFIIFFGAWTVDRFVHLLWAVAFFVACLILLFGVKVVASDKSAIVEYWSKATHPVGVPAIHALFMTVLVLFLGSWVPDLDWKFGVHRSSLTHSVLPYFAVACLVNNANIGNIKWAQMLLPPFAVALGSHLIIDFFQGGNLVGVPAYLEFAFYFVNGIALCIIAYLKMRPIQISGAQAPNKNGV